MRQPSRIYLAGKVTGLNYKSAKKKFDEAKHFLLTQGFDEVVNPMEHVPKGTGWTDAMLILLPYLSQCDYIAILPGYETSNGTCTEYYFARGMESEGKMKAIIHLTQPEKQTHHAKQV
jgi:hypothetical protein